MLIHRVALKNLLSFGPDGINLSLKPLNVLIGPNGSGKSNLIEAMSLLQAAPRELAKPIRKGGGIHGWLWKGAEDPVATLEVIVDHHFGKPQPLRYSISFEEFHQRFFLSREVIESENPESGDSEPLVFYQNDQYGAAIGFAGILKKLSTEESDRDRSILSRLRDPDQYPQITILANKFDRIKIYRDWSFGRNTPIRVSQMADLRNDYLEEDCGNLGMVLNRLRRDHPSISTRILSLLQQLYPAILDADVSVEGGTVQVFFREEHMLTSMPATRLSDGTLRFLCLIVLLCDPKPAPLICIEEPELGLHPDVIVCLGELLKEASTRTQLIVTTHSDVLVDSLEPEDIIVCEKHEGQSTMERLDVEKLKVWLKDYSLGQLWVDGELGGNRW